MVILLFFCIIESQRVLNVQVANLPGKYMSFAFISK